MSEDAKPSDDAPTSSVAQVDAVPGPATLSITERLSAKRTQLCSGLDATAKLLDQPPPVPGVDAKDFAKLVTRFANRWRCELAEFDAFVERQFRGTGASKLRDWVDDFGTPRVYRKFADDEYLMDTAIVVHFYLQGDLTLDDVKPHVLKCAQILYAKPSKRPQKSDGEILDALRAFSEGTLPRTDGGSSAEAALDAAIGRDVRQRIKHAVRIPKAGKVGRAK